MAHPFPYQLTDSEIGQLERLASAEGIVVGHWFTDAARLPGQFLLLLQKPPGARRVSAFVAFPVQLMCIYYLRLYQVDPDETPGLDRACPLNDLDDWLLAHYAAFTNDPARARDMLSPSAVSSLVEWAEHRAAAPRVTRSGQPGLLLVLLSPRGLRLVFPIEADDPTQVDAIAQLGTRLACAQTLKKS